MKKFAIEKVYKVECETIKNSRSSSKFIHGTGDIDASGDELEIPIRDMLERRLPKKYIVGHGHIVDSNLSVSPQFDIIIADTSAAPLLYEGENGMQYFPYESVYAVGEIKSTFYNSSKQVEKFAKTIGDVKSKLVRQEVKDFYLGQGISLTSGILSNRPEVLNELMSFMIFGDSGNMKPRNLKDQLKASSGDNVPNTICFLDGKLVVKSKPKIIDGQVQMDEFILTPSQQKERSGLSYYHLEFMSDEPDVSALTMLMVGLFDHLHTTILKPPHLNSYLKEVILNSNSMAEKIS